MEHSKPLSKAQLKVEIKRFIADLDRGISINLFAELCGISKQHLDDVFKYENEPLTEYVQRRVNKGYADWKAGKVKVMRLKGKKWVEYRKVPTPPLIPTSKLVLTSQGFQVKVGFVNRHDYSQPTLDEQMRG
jgi:hypothetical protein